MRRVQDELVARDLGSTRLMLQVHDEFDLFGARVGSGRGFGSPDKRDGVGAVELSVPSFWLMCPLVPTGLRLIRNIAACLSRACAQIKTPCSEFEKGSVMLVAALRVLRAPRQELLYGPRFPGTAHIVHVRYPWR